MRETYWGYWLVLLGVFVIGVMLLVNNISTVDTQNYYNIKEVTQASMIDAVDFSYYRLYGNLKISEQKFVENFIRRFAENINLANTYDVDFYDLYEVPPKVSVKISTGSRTFNIANSQNDYDNVATLSAILELGVDGEGGVTEKTKKVTSCKLHVYTDLMKYFKGETVDGYSLVSDGITLTNEQKESLNKTKTLDEFRIWFNNNYRIDGMTAKEYLAQASNNKWANLNSQIKEYIKRGWIDISSN